MNRVLREHVVEGLLPQHAQIFRKPKFPVRLANKRGPRKPREFFDGGTCIEVPVFAIKPHDHIRGILGESAESLFAVAQGRIGFLLRSDVDGNPFQVAPLGVEAARVPAPDHSPADACNGALEVIHAAVPGNKCKQPFPIGRGPRSPRRVYRRPGPGRRSRSPTAPPGRLFAKSSFPSLRRTRKIPTWGVVEDVAVTLLTLKQGLLHGLAPGDVRANADHADRFAGLVAQEVGPAIENGLSSVAGEVDDLPPPFAPGISSPR